MELTLGYLVAIRQQCKKSWLPKCEHMKFNLRCTERWVQRTCLGSGTPLGLLPQPKHNDFKR